MWGLAFLLLPFIGIFTVIAESNKELRWLLPYVTGSFLVVFLPLLFYTRYRAFHCPICGKRFSPVSQYFIVPFPEKFNHCRAQLR